MKGEVEAVITKPCVEFFGDVWGPYIGSLVFKREDKGFGLWPVHEGVVDAVGHGDDAGVFAFSSDGDLALSEVNVLPAEKKDFVAAEACICGEGGDEGKFWPACFLGGGDAGLKVVWGEVARDAALDFGDLYAVGEWSFGPSALGDPAGEGLEDFEVGAHSAGGSDGEALVAPLGDEVGVDAVQWGRRSDVLGESVGDGGISFVGALAAHEVPIFAPVDDGGLEVDRYLSAWFFQLYLVGKFFGLLFLVFGPGLAVSAASCGPVHIPAAAVWSVDDGCHGASVVDSRAWRKAQPAGQPAKQKGGAEH